MRNAKASKDITLMPIQVTALTGFLFSSPDHSRRVRLSGLLAAMELPNI